METLRELIEIVSRKKIKAVDSDASGIQYARMMQLYDLVATGKVKTDEEAEQILFPSADSSLKYKRLKLALKKYLHRMLFLVDLNLPHFQLRQEAYFECYRNWAAVKILVGRNARASTIELSTELLQLARKYDFTDIALDIARTLRLQYGSIYGDLKKYEQYGAMAHALEAVFDQENQAEELYTDLVVRFVNDKSAKEDVHEKALQYYKLIEPGLTQFDSYRLHLGGRLIEVMIHTSINDYKNTVDVCDRAIRFFESKQYVANVPLQAFYHQAMVCYVQLRDFERGRQIATRAIALLEEGTFNWFKFEEMLVLLSLHTQSYQDAYVHFKQAVQHRRFAALPEGVRQVWKIIEAYLYYLAESGLIKPESDDGVFSRFRIARFLNETPLYSKDKRGMNIPILIFQIVYLIREKRYNETIDRIEAIEKYTSRYLVKDDTYRSNCFIKMLLQIPAANFHHVATIRKAEKLTRQLQAVTLDYANQSHDVEIVPYEHLWDMVLKSLQ
jgi:hypothetical protein